MFKLFRLKNVDRKLLIFIELTWTGSGDSLSSSDGHVGETNGICDVFLNVDLDGFSESLHCSTSISTSSSMYRSTDNGPKTLKEKLLIMMWFNCI